jgi:hypothetical protein
VSHWLLKSNGEKNSNFDLDIHFSFLKLKEFSDSYMVFEVLMPVTMKITVFSDDTIQSGSSLPMFQKKLQLSFSE